MKALLKVSGMHCRSCEVLLTDSLSELPGVKSVKVSFKDGKADIDYDAQLIDEKKLRSAIEKEGYKVS